jgi:hypothetical protein
MISFSNFTFVIRLAVPKIHTDRWYSTALAAGARQGLASTVIESAGRAHRAAASHSREADQQQ